MKITFILTIITIFFLNSCASSFYQVPVAQGNIISVSMLSKLETGLSKAQVQYIMGTPSINDPFDSNLKIAGDYKQQLILRKKNLLKTLHFNQIISIMPIGGISNKNKLSILKGYRETIIFSFELYNFKLIYIICIKLFLNIYSIFYTRKFKNLKIKY